VRFVVVGAGAIGGVVGGRLFQAGHEVTLVARGGHLEVLARRGLRLDDPTGSVSLDVPAVGTPADAGLQQGDVVLLATKSQDTVAALRAVGAAGVDDLAVVCLQNGVQNERAALRRFARVYAVPVMCPTGHLEPGVVQAFSSPTTGLLDIGRYPSGLDETAEAVAAAFRGATFESVVRPDVARWKWSKLLMNLGNALQALCGPSAPTGDLYRRARDEAEQCLAAAGIDWASAEEDRERRGGHLTLAPVGDAPRPGGSTWQSLERGTGSVETEYLNGEIVLVGRMHGVATPVNELLCRRMAHAARTRRPPGTVDVSELEAELA
jgi:2-dehydropantoate 2-reductase